MLKINLYSSKGVKKEPVNLPKELEAKENLDLLAQAIRVYEARRHPGLSKVKGRGEVKGSTRKIYRQKGTGRARHGGIRAPIFVGGGQVHGPDGLKRKLTLPKKMRRKALAMAMTKKVREKNVIAIDGVKNFTKTKEAQKFIDAVIKKEKKERVNNIAFSLSKENSKSEMFLRNIENVNVFSFDNLNVYQVYYSGLLILDKDVLKKKRSPAQKGVKSKK